MSGLTADVKVAEELVRGSVDTHVHIEALPHRRWNVFQLAKEAHEAGMRAIVLKNGYGLSSGIAHLANSIVGGVEMMGSIVLNRWIGGLNSVAVKDLAKYGSGTRVVSMPTLSSVNNHRRMGWPLDTAVPVSEKDELLPQVKEILGICADNNQVLYTGHLAPKETILLIEEARKIGVKKIVVTHPLQIPVFASLEEQEEMVKKGAFIEHCFVACTPYIAVRYRGLWNPLNPLEIVEAIRKVGPEHCVLGTDFGATQNPSAVEGFRMFIHLLLGFGVDRKSIERMAKDNPTNLLD